MDAREAVFEIQAKPVSNPGNFFFLSFCLYGPKLAKKGNLQRKLFCLVSFKRGEHRNVANSFYMLTTQLLLRCNILYNIIYNIIA